MTIQFYHHSRYAGIIRGLYTKFGTTPFTLQQAKTEFPEITPGTLAALRNYKAIQIAGGRRRPGRTKGTDGKVTSTLWEVTEYAKNTIEKEQK